MARAKTPAKKPAKRAAVKPRSHLSSASKEFFELATDFRRQGANAVTAGGFSVTWPEHADPPEKQPVCGFVIGPVEESYEE